MAAFATNSPPQRRPFWHFPSLQPPWWGLSRSLCESVSSYRYLSILRLASSSHISWFSTRAQPVWRQPSPQEQYSSRTQRQSSILLAFSSSHPPRRQSSGVIRPIGRPGGNLLAAFATIGPGSGNLLGDFRSRLPAALWRQPLGSSRPRTRSHKQPRAPQTVARTHKKRPPGEEGGLLKGGRALGESLVTRRPGSGRW